METLLKAFLGLAGVVIVLTVLGFVGCVICVKQRTSSSPAFVPSITASSKAPTVKKNVVPTPQNSNGTFQRGKL